MEISGEERRRNAQATLDAVRKVNASHSTGPVDTAVTRHNATRHGVFSQTVIVPGVTSPAEIKQFQQFRDDLWRDLAPVGALEELLADKLVSTAWRMRRVLTYEAYSAAGERMSNHPAFPALMDLDLVRRYEAHLSRQFHHTFTEFQYLRAARLRSAPAEAALLEGPAT